MLTEEQIINLIQKYIRKLNNRNILSQDYAIEGHIYKARIWAYQDVIDKEFCLSCGKEIVPDTTALNICSKECSEKIYG
jgi:hypothetical protein